jgi:uncharacterized radical SAM superfamily protein
MLTQLLKLSTISSTMAEHSLLTLLVKRVKVEAEAVVVVVVSAVDAVVTEVVMVVVAVAVREENSAGSYLLVC